METPGTGNSVGKGSGAVRVWRESTRQGERVAQSADHSKPDWRVCILFLKLASGDSQRLIKDFTLKG